MVNELYFVTNNENKIREAEEILQIPVKIFRSELNEIQSMDLKEIVSDKVKNAYKLIKKPVIVDDVGVYIRAWNGFPGPFIKFLQKSGDNPLILKMMKEEENREALVQAAIGYFDGKDLKLFIGEDKGKISQEIRGDVGWGFDFIFIPSGYDKTYAELGPEVKNKISHRRRALEKLKEFLL
jgi:XTP/dITP diphosphohydrolase